MSANTICLSKSERVITQTETYRHQAITAAKDLCYGKEVLDRLKAAKTIGEIDRIMRAARKKKFGNF